MPPDAISGDRNSVRPPLSALAVNASSSAALELRDGELRAVGDRYKAIFDAAQVAFIPALGKRAPRNQTLHLGLAEIGRGEGRTPVGTPERRHGELRVEYVRPDCVERYDVTAAGLEQSFVLSALPAGRGDLHVRVRFATELQPVREAQGWRFELAGVGGLRIGGVTGIDANGKRATGTIDVRGDMLDLSLPADFVDHAALPLVVDPLIGSVFNAFTFDDDDRDPDCAYDVTNNLYLVVFERIYSATDIDIHGQRVSALGALVGGRVYVENATTNEFDAAVANINLRDRFVVAYYRGGDIVARSVNAADGAVGAEFGVATGTDTQQQCDVGGETTTADDDALCVWWNSTTGDIEAAQIGVNADGTLFVWDQTLLWDGASLDGRFPRISKGGGTTGFHMVAFEVVFSSTDVDPYCCIVDRELTIQDAPRPADSGVNLARSPDVDGDGRHWVIAWDLAEAAFPTKQDVLCRSISLDMTEPVGFRGRWDGTITTVTADADDDEFGASVTAVGGTTLVAWTDQDGTAFSTYFKPLDPFTCLTCESGQQFLNGSFLWDTLSKGCGQISGGGVEDHALLVLDTFDSGGTSTGSIQAQRWQSADGLLTNLAGGCGADAGDIYATCARTGNANFAVKALANLPNVPALLVIGRDRVDLPCGTCRLIPDPWTGTVVSTTTDFAGQAQFAAAIPAVPAITGLQFYLQWLIAEPASPGCYLFGADLTRAIRMSIQ